MLEKARLRALALFFLAAAACENAPPAESPAVTPALSPSVAGETEGAGGLGLRGVGEGAGGSGDGIGLGGSGPNLGGPHAGNTPRVRDEGARMDGPLPKEVIRRIVRQHFGQIRKCYLDALAIDSQLTGIVRTEFVIAHDGSVSSAKDAGSTMPSAQVVSCVVGAFKTFMFPAPEAGTVTVTYPLTFTPE